jgi:signal transduction histidine kinase
MTLCYGSGMGAIPLRDRLAIVIAMVALTLGVATAVVGQYDDGVQLAVDGQDRIVVGDVDPHSPAARFGIQTGMIVTQLNGFELLRLPASVYPQVEPTPDPDSGETPAVSPIGVEPLAPTFVPVDQATRDMLLVEPVFDLAGIQPWDLEQGSVDNWAVVSIYDDGADSVREALPAVVLGVLLLVLVGWYLATGRAGDRLRPLAIPLAVATAVPFLARPLEASWVPMIVAAGGIVTVLAMIPLAMALVERVEEVGERQLVTLIVGICTVGAAVLAIVVALTDAWSGEGIVRWALVGSIPLIPGLAAAGPIQPGGLRGAAASSGRVLESTEYAVVGVTPLMALATDMAPYLIPLQLWFLLVLTAGRFTIRPLARLATRATLQRDLVVAATEAERARVAADIHDDALQELTLLVHRLDAAGDTEGADIARAVSDRLRAICGDLRLPILDDLGVGPALDWLVLRIERLAGGEVRLERTDGARPPADVELAFFRVAQEALSNAVKHGKPPIVVRYSTSDAGASLSIDDAGPGIEPGAGDAAERTGHFGLSNMQQRAEAIGAILDVRRWPAGGTHVKLDWRAH